jgi:hypothetical protein
MEKRECFGIDSVTQEELQVAVKVLYLQEFHSPPKIELKPIVTLLKN